MIFGQHLNATPYKFPLFTNCFKAHPFSQPNSTTYLMLKDTQPNLHLHNYNQQNNKDKNSNKFICSTFQNQKSNCCFIVLQGECLNQLIEEKQRNKIYPFLTQQQIWSLIVCLCQAFDILVASECSHKLTHLKQYSIRRVSSKQIYKLIYHQSMISQLDKTKQVAWNQLYLSPQQLTGQFVKQKSIVFSFGLVLLNLISNQDRKISVYDTQRIQIDEQRIKNKITLARTKYGYSKLLTNFIEKCLVVDHQTRYDFTQLKKCLYRKLERQYMRQSQFLSMIIQLQNNKDKSKSLKYDIVIPPYYTTQSDLYSHLNITKTDPSKYPDKLLSNRQAEKQLKYSPVQHQPNEQTGEMQIQQQIHKLQKSTLSYHQDNSRSQGTMFVDVESDGDKDKRVKSKKKNNHKFQGTKTNFHKLQNKDDKLQPAPTPIPYTSSNYKQDSDQNQHRVLQNKNHAQPNQNNKMQLQNYQTLNNQDQNGKYGLEKKDDVKYMGDRAKQNPMNYKGKEYLTNFQYRGTFGARIPQTLSQQQNDNSSTVKKIKQAKKLDQQSQEQQQDKQDEKYNNKDKSQGSTNKMKHEIKLDIPRQAQKQLKKSNASENKLKKKLLQQYNRTNIEKDSHNNQDALDHQFDRIAIQNYPKDVESRFNYSTKDEQDSGTYSKIQNIIQEEVETPKGFGKQGKKFVFNHTQNQYESQGRRSEPKQKTKVKTKFQIYQPRGTQKTTHFHQYPQNDQIPELITQMSVLQLQQCRKPIQYIIKKIDKIGVWVEGDLYYGEFLNGRRNGLSLQIFANGQYYYGYFKQDLFSGEGFYYWNDREYFFGVFELGQKLWGRLQGQIQYQGNFKNNKRHGKGTCWYTPQQIYVGQWYNGKRQGYGTLYEFQGQKFVGNWYKGKRKGQGYIQTQSMRISGLWNDETIQSDVLIQYTNGDKFKGKIDANLQKLNGEYVCKSGTTFRGQFENDSPKEGEFIYSNGDRYVGTLLNMRRHGYGEYYYKNTGQVYKGYWENNAKKI